jgi:hypothetical protein
MARPRKEIDFELAEKLAQIHCTQEEIASVLGMSVDTLQRSKRFNELYNKARLLGRASLRRMQWKLAESGDRTILIWLGKQILGQRDNMDIEHSGSFQIRIGFEDDEE